MKAVAQLVLGELLELPARCNHRRFPFLAEYIDAAAGGER